MTLTSCGGPLYTFFKQEQDKDRRVASVAIERLMTEENESFESQIEERLLALHSYYVIAQNHLHLFDKSLNEDRLIELYKGSHYLSLLATRTQIDEIERELKELHLSLPEKRKEDLEARITKFGNKNLLTRLSVENLSYSLGMKSSEIFKDAGPEDVEKEYASLEKIKEFQIFEKNIEHISHLMEMNLSSKEEKWKPSEGRDGSLSGQEFPAKVWSLTFSNGPHEKITSEILKNLKTRGLKATFFQQGSKVSEYPEEAKKVSQYGMEVGTQAMHQRELNKVGHLTLEREITLATQGMEKSMKLDIRFFRLPYGSGIEVPMVREMIAKNKLIHVFWNIDSLDWPPQTTGRIVERTKKLMKKTPRDAGVILFHDQHPRSLLASIEIMDHLKLDSRRVCTLGTIVNEMNQGQKSICGSNSY
jgi:peptidoglycan/xylan/chitin deacetylase (PgdA/CDA1 family)